MIRPTHAEFEELIAERRLIVSQLDDNAPRHDFSFLDALFRRVEALTGADRQNFIFPQGEPNA